MGKILAIVTLFFCAHLCMALDIIIQPSIQNQAKMQATREGQERLRIQRAQQLSVTLLDAISNTIGHTCNDIKPVANGARVISCDIDNLTQEQKTRMIDIISRIPGINYAEEDIALYPLSSPTNYNTTYQWDMPESMNMSAAGYPESNFTGDNFLGAWNNLANPAGQGITIAVLDSGYTQHPAFGFIPGGSLTGTALESGLQANESGYGYDFITSCWDAGVINLTTVAPGCTSTSGNRLPQPNAIDLGDWMSSSQQSSWHGTLVAGGIVGQGVSGPYPNGLLGGAPGAKVLPVRVASSMQPSAFAMLSTLINGMYWAAGMQVPGYESVPLNTTPAKIFNISLGTRSACIKPLQDSITNIKANSPNSSIIIIAAGNDQLDYTTNTPANCNGVIPVAAVGPTNLLASYSNYGNVIIAASGGDVGINPAIGGLYRSMYSSSATPPTYYPALPGNFIWNGQNQNGGTSSAAPRVAAAMAVLLSVNPGLTESDLVEILQDSGTILDNNGCNSSNNNKCLTLPVRLNVANALNYVQQNVLLLHVENDAVLHDSRSAEAIVKNYNSVDIEIESTIVTPTQGDFITAMHCSNNTSDIAESNGGTCTLTVTAVTNGNIAGYITLFDNSDNIISRISVSTNNSPSNPPPAGGGCSAINNGDDGSLLLALALAMVFYIYIRLRRSNI